MRSTYRVGLAKLVFEVRERDIKLSFDEMDHDILMRQVSAKVKDKRVLRLIGDYLRAPVQRDGRLEKRTRGTPQGRPLSPLLANIYLDALDKELERRGLNFCRYADDVVIFVSSERSGQRVLASLTAWLGDHLKLRVNATKSGVNRARRRQNSWASNWTPRATQSRWVQPPDAEDRTSGGVGGVTGAIPLPRPDLRCPGLSRYPYRCC